MLKQADVHVRREVRAGGLAAFVTLDDGHGLNILGSALMERFVGAMGEISPDPDLRCVVVEGAGKRAFVAGADLDEMASLAGPEDAVQFIGRVHACCEAVRACPAPVIARIEGAALGAGLELAAYCDLRLAAPSALFGMPEVKVGVPSVVEAALLPRLVGWGRAQEILLLGETFGADAALAMGLVNSVDADLDAAVERRLAAVFAARPAAVRLQKALMRRWEDLPLDRAIEAGIEAFAEAFRGDEPQAAMNAWKARRAQER